MNDPAPLPTDGDAVQEELVAYLDGELNAEEVANIEQRLASDDTYRQRLQSLQRAWDLLDYLPQAEVGESFTQTTVEMVAVTAVDELSGKKTTGAGQPVGWLIAGGGAIVAALVGFLLISSLSSQENKQLVEDLPVIENVDAYHNTEDLEFLKMLDREGLFVQEEEDAS